MSVENPMDNLGGHKDIGEDEEPEAADVVIDQDGVGIKNAPAAVEAPRPPVAAPAVRRPLLPPPAAPPTVTSQAIARLGQPDRTTRIFTHLLAAAAGMIVYKWWTNRKKR